MSVLYVTEQGATVRFISGRIIVRKEKKVLQEVPAFKLDQIVAVGNVILTTSAATFCMQQGVDVAFLSSTGKYRGRLQPEFAKSAVLRQRQYERANDADFCLQTSSAIVAGKIKNMLAMIRRQRRLREGAAEDGRTPIRALENLLPKVAAATEIESVRGFEGAATAEYFKAFRAALKADFDFPARVYHPPSDEVNALLSLGYSLLYNNLHGMVNLVGLDPYMGYFHRPRHGHAALVSDLTEEFRSVVIDRLILTTLNKRSLTKADFYTDDQGRIRLMPASLKRFFTLYAAALAEPVYYAPLNIRTTYRQLLEYQTRHLARVLLGEVKGYQPFDAETAANYKERKALQSQEPERPTSSD